MALQGFDYPGFKSNEDHAQQRWRQEIFDIIALCVMSEADIDIVKLSPMTVRQAFTALTILVLKESTSCSEPGNFRCHCTLSRCDFTG